MTLRKWVCHAVDVAAAATGHLRTLERRAASGVTALMYHRVLPDAEHATYPRTSLAISESQFRAQVAWLGAHARTMTVRDALAPGVELGRGKPVVCLTFDDGYADNAEVAAPTLEEHGLRATFYVTTGFIAGPAMLWFDRATLHWERDRRQCLETAAAIPPGDGDRWEPQDLDTWMSHRVTTTPEHRAAVLEALDRATDLSDLREQHRPMSVAQIRALHERGHEIGSHTRTHPMLPTLRGADLDAEIGPAREDLRGWTGGDVHGFCYPNGDFSDDVVAAVRRAGHTYAVTTQPGLNAPGTDPYRLRRRWIHTSGSTNPLGGVSTLSFRAETFGLHDRMRGRD